MAKIKFREINFRRASLARIADINAIVEEYQAQGLRLTVRQTFYQLVVRSLVSNSEREYHKLSRLLSDAREAGLVDWDAIEDRGRIPDLPVEFSGLEELVDVALRSYRLPRWQGQAVFVELWCEKRALAGVLSPLARRFHVALQTNTGFSSSSAVYKAAERFQAAAEDGRKSILIYLGDFDPSGEDMVRDVIERLALYGATVEVQKIALTREQVDKYQLPPNPAKLTDSRARAFVEKHGPSSWELDALPPPVLVQLVSDAIGRVMDEGMMAEMLDAEERDKARLRQLLEVAA